MKQIQIKGRTIGDGYPAYIIAEMSGNHAGSMERAKEIIRAAKEAGADCIKIQTYTPDTLTIDCHNQYFQVENGTWEGENLYSLYGKAYTPWEWQQELKEEAERVGIDFLSTPFDISSVDFLEEMGMEFYKIASFEMIDLPLLRYIASKGKPIIMSTGMGTLEEIGESVEAIRACGNEPIALMKCSSSYPAVPEQMNLRTIVNLKEKFDLPVGLSDHSMGHMSATTAVTLGANIIEKHFCLGREIENPDASFSMTPQEFREMVDAVRQVEASLGKVFYGVAPEEESSMVFRRSVFVVDDVKAGERLTKENTRGILHRSNSTTWIGDMHRKNMHAISMQNICMVNWRNETFLPSSWNPCWVDDWPMYTITLQPF
jgi:pseudaminic acid synthase